MSIKKLAELYPKYILSLEHQFTKTEQKVKATITLPGENNTFLKRVSGNFTAGATLQEAEELALKDVTSKILGNKVTSKLLSQFPIFDLQIVPFDGPVATPFGVKILLSVCTEDGKPYRNVTSLATGTDAKQVETDALKNAINNVLGV